MEPNSDGGLTLNHYEITQSLAALEANGKKPLAHELHERTEGVGRNTTLDIDLGEAKQVIRALTRGISSLYYGQQNDLMARGLLRTFEEFREV